jgi:hypothetical protein
VYAVDFLLGCCGSSIKSRGPSCDCHGPLLSWLCEPRTLLVPLCVPQPLLLLLLYVVKGTVTPSPVPICGCFSLLLFLLLVFLLLEGFLSCCPISWYLLGLKGLYYSPVFGQFVVGVCFSSVCGPLLGKTVYLTSW